MSMPDLGREWPTTIVCQAFSARTRVPRIDASRSLSMGALQGPASRAKCGRGAVLASHGNRNEKTGGDWGGGAYPRRSRAGLGLIRIRHSQPAVEPGVTQGAHDSVGELTRR
jgi:hypothetical protein